MFAFACGERKLDLIKKCGLYNKQFGRIMHTHSDNQLKIYVKKVRILKNIF